MTFIEIIQLGLDFLVAVGTISATIVALYLGLRQNRRSIDSVFIWGTPTNYQPILMIHNIGIGTIVIDNVKLYYKNRLIGCMDFFEDHTLRKNAIIESGKTEKIIVDKKFIQIKTPTSIEKKYFLKVVVTPRDGKPFSSKQKYSFKELDSLLFGQRLFENK